MQGQGVGEDDLKSGELAYFLSVSTKKSAVNGAFSCFFVAAWRCPWD